MSLDAVMTEVKIALRTIPALADVPEEPPEEITSFPVCLVYPNAGGTQLGASRGSTGVAMCWEFHTIAIDVYQLRANLPADLARMKPFVRSVPAALIKAYAADRFNGTVVTLGDGQGTNGTRPIRYQLIMPEPGPNGINAVGFRFELDVSFQEEVTL